MVDKESQTLVEFLSGHPGSYTANVLQAVQVNQKQWPKHKKDIEPGRYTRSIKDAITGKKNKWYGMNSQGVEGVENEEQEAGATVGQTSVGAMQIKKTPQAFTTGSQETGAGANKIDLAKPLFQQLHSQPDMSRKDIIAEFVKQLGVTESTAVSYYERIAKELGLTGKDTDDESEMKADGMGDEDPAAMGTANSELSPEEEMPDDYEDSGDTNKAGVIRYVDNAHLVYKRRNEEGTFDELWLYNVSNDMKDELVVRRAILAGTDISKNKTRSEDGNQNYNLTTLGNAQYLHITGLPN